MALDHTVRAALIPAGPTATFERQLSDPTTGTLGCASIAGTGRASGQLCGCVRYLIYGSFAQFRRGVTAARKFQMMWMYESMVHNQPCSIFL